MSSFGRTVAFRITLTGVWLWTILVWTLPAQSREPIAWPVMGEDGIAPDPRAVWGRLANGLRHVVVPNATPEGKVSLRLVIEAGSLMEEEDQRGLAHFLEHMAFKGSTNIAPGQMVQTLARQGLAFGPDTNAQTGFEQTIYKLDLPRNDAAILGTGLDMLAEIADRLTILAAQIEPERGVVLSERRLRNTPGQRAFEASMLFQFPGARLAERLPIGDEEVIATAPRQRFVDFYRKWYVPERIVVVVAGDIDPRTTAAMIEERFRDLAPSPVPPSDPDPGELRPRGLEARLHTDRGLPVGLSLTVLRPWDERKESVATWQLVATEQLASTILEQRLEVIAARSGAPFTGASVGTVRWRRLAAAASMRLGVVEDRWKEALQIAATEIARAVRFGVTEDERAQALRIMRGGLEAKADTAETMDSRRIVDELIYAISEEAVFTSAATDLQLFDRVVAEIDLAAIGQSLRQLWGEAPPLIQLTGPFELEDATAQILAAWTAGANAEVEPPEAFVSASFAYTDFGPPGVVVARETIADLGITSLDFANGTTLDLKPTPFAKDTVQIAVRFGNGRAGLPTDRPGLDLLARWGFREGGLGRHDNATLERLFAGRRVGWQLVIGDGALAFTAETSRRDQEATFQLLAAYLTDPGYRPEAMDGFRRRLDATYRRLGASPQGPVATIVQRLIHGDDPRFGIAPRELVEARTLVDLEAWLRPQLEGGPLQMAIVGDIEPEATEALVARTIGALPPRAPLAAPTAAAPTFPEAIELQVLSHDGPAEQASVLVHWSTADGRDQRLGQGLDVLADILEDRLVARVRGEEGATYSPSVGQEGSPAFPGFGYIAVSLDVAADNAQRMLALVLDVAASLQRDGVTADELVRALEPRLARVRSSGRNNGYWLLRVMTGMRAYPERLENARTLERDVSSIDKAMIDGLARTYLRADRALEVLVLPRRG